MTEPNEGNDVENTGSRCSAHDALGVLRREVYELRGGWVYEVDIGDSSMSWTTTI